MPIANLRFRSSKVSQITHDASSPNITTDPDNSTPEQIVFDLRRDYYSIRTTPATNSITYITSDMPAMHKLVQEALLASEPEDIEAATNFLHHRRTNRPSGSYKINPFEHANYTTRQIAITLPPDTHILTKHHSAQKTKTE